MMGSACWDCVRTLGTCAQAKGGSFGQGADRELFRFTLGDQTAIPAIEEAVTSMKPGGIRRLIVPVELGYPDNDFNKKGPKPTTFSVSSSALSALLWESLPYLASFYCMCRASGR